MRQLLVFLTLAAVSVGCDARPQLRSAKGFSTESATWSKLGAFNGKRGTAVTIQLKDSTEQFWRAIFHATLQQRPRMSEKGFCGME